MVNVELPKSRIVAQLIPSGALKIVIVSIAGGFITYFVSHQSTSPEELVGTSYWVMGIPGLLFAVADKFAGKSFKSYRIEKLTPLHILLGTSVFGLLIATACGVDLSAHIRSIL
jgi:hypothetical protein